MAFVLHVIVNGREGITEYSLICIVVKKIIKFLKSYVCVTAAGLRAGNTQYTFVTAGIGPAEVHVGSLWQLGPLR